MNIYDEIKTEPMVAKVSCDCGRGIIALSKKDQLYMVMTSSDPNSVNVDCLCGKTLLKLKCLPTDNDGNRFFDQMREILKHFEQEK